MNPLTPCFVAALMSAFLPAAPMPQGCTASTTTLGAPCTSTVLTSTLPILGSTMTMTVAGVGASVPGIVFHSPDTGVVVPFFGCDVHLSELNTAGFFTTDSSGSGAVPASLPANPALCGAELIVQAVAFTGSGPVPGLLMDISNAVRLRAGNAPPTGGSFPTSWIHGAANCSLSTDPPIQVHAYSPRTWILRQSACLNFEAPFMYLLAGDTRALLIDTGATASAVTFPLQATVQGLLDAYELANNLPDLQLVVAHSHGHGDHNQGNAQFLGQPNTTVVGTSISALQAFFGITTWPTQIVSYDLGGRIVDIVPTPGHHTAHITTYDRETGALLTGDTLYPGFLFISSLSTYKTSIDRLVAFAASNTITDIVGGHIEMTATAFVAYPYGTVYQPNERALGLQLSHLLELDAALDSISGPITQPHADFVIQVF